ncbi:MAG: glycosyltransferase family 4 protein [Armatimonadetes bacterium]|nr:glycosyltransferase family 4 protein [Armatimonadota bacterium]
MHIGIDARSIFAGGGGDRTYFRNLIAAMARLSPDDRWTLYADSDDPDRDSLRAPNVTVAPALPAPVGALWNVTALLPRLRLDRVDLLHSQYTLPPVGRAPCPMVVTIHDVTFRLFPQWSPRHENRVQNLLIPRAARRAAAVLTGSRCAAEDIARTLHVPPERIHVTPYGVEARFSPPDEAEKARVRARYGLPEAYVLGVGLLRSRKNAAVVLRAAASLRARGRWPAGVVLVLTGAWDGAPEAAAAAADPRLAGAVRVLGGIPDADLPALYGAARACVYPSLYEGFGLPPLEAMACGVPTVSSENSSIPEVVGDAGLLVRDYRDPDAWAAALTRLLTDDALRAALIPKGLARARLFSWERTARETLRAYEMVVGLL